jgi:hypothetical protein
MYVCMCMYVHVCMCMCICSYVCAHAFVEVSVREYACKHKVCQCVHVFLYAHYMYVLAFTYTFRPADTWNRYMGRVERLTCEEFIIGVEVCVQCLGLLDQEKLISKESFAHAPVRVMHASAHVCLNKKITHARTYTRRGSFGSFWK